MTGHQTLKTISALLTRSPSAANLATIADLQGSLFYSLSRAEWFDACAPFPYPFTRRLALARTGFYQDDGRAVSGRQRKALLRPLSVRPEEWKPLMSTQAWAFAVDRLNR